MREWQAGVPWVESEWGEWRRWRLNEGKDGSWCGATGRGREGRIKGPIRMDCREVPLGLVSQSSPWHLNLCWPGRDCLSGTGDITRGADLWPCTSSSPPQHSPCFLKHPFTCFLAFVCFQRFLQSFTNSLVIIYPFTISDNRDKIQYTQVKRSGYKIRYGNYRGRSTGLTCKQSTAVYWTGVSLLAGCL